MIEFKFEVNGQELRRTDRVNPAGDVVGQLWAVFEFDDWWEDTFPIARFMKSGVIYDVEIIDDRCLVPYQALSGEGKFYVTVYAVVPNGRKTTNKEVVEYTASGLNLSITEISNYETVYAMALAALNLLPPTPEAPETMYLNGNVEWSKIHIGSSATGTFVSQDEKTVTVVNGIITSIV